MKISREPKDPRTGNANSEKNRYQIVLDYGVNAPFGAEWGTPAGVVSLGATVANLAPAMIYKFYPPQVPAHVDQVGTSL